MAATSEFVSLVLLARDMAHLAHWKTKSYAEHIALGEFYEGVLPLIDGFVEQYQGYYEELLPIQRADDDQKADIKELLDYQIEWIEKNRYKVCEKDETSMQNTIDEIVALYQTTLYKLRFLK